MTASVSILVGAQWGDEGKGKWIDILAADCDIVVRYQGGNNAGHTLYVNGQKVVLHQLPSGVFQESLACALAAGVVINPEQLVSEIAKCKTILGREPAQLWLSARAHVITPWHIYLDGERESLLSQPIGTTKRGIGPTYSEKAARSGLRLGYYVDHDERRAWLTRMCETEPRFKAFYDQNRSHWDDFEKAAAPLAPYVCDAETKLRSAVKQGKRLLLEGAQGALLDLDHGTYPYVTSSSTCAGGGLASVGLSAKAITRVLGVGKAYTTRVGGGPFPTELTDAAGSHLSHVGQEFGATTGRPRRCGWYDAVAMRYSAGVNGFDGIVLNKMDVLTGLPEVKLAIAYRHPKLGEIRDFPWDERILAECEPVYESHPGWQISIPKSGRINDLPATALAFVRAIERHTGVPVLYVGTGVNRSDSLRV